MRLIDADALIISDEECTNTICRDCKMQVNGCEDFFDIIKNAPTIEPERKTGKWIKDRLISTNGGTYPVYRCSECEAYYQETGYGWNFCPHCGADMRGEQDG